MEDTKSLLMMVLHKIFQNQPKTIENTFQLIHSFNNGKIDKKNYEKTLKTICDLMNDELPSPILVYVLTLVDMPQDFESQSPLIETMRKTHDVLPDIKYVRPHLLDFLNNMKPSHSKIRHVEVAEKCQNINNNAENNKLVKPLNSAPSKSSNVRVVKKSTRKLLPKVTAENPKKLLDICACYVVQNEKALKNMYKKRQTHAWNLINNDVFSGSRLEQCYNVVKDLNKKTKWLREIESNNISTEILMEEYKNTDVFFRENHIYDELTRNPFKLSHECEKAVDSMFQD